MSGYGYKVGDDCWTVFEHLYYVDGKAAPHLEYCVAKSKITSVFAVGRSREIRYTYKSPEGYNRIGYSKVEDVGIQGKSCFMTCSEALEEAERRSDRYDSVWSFMDETPIRRTWRTEK